MKTETPGREERVVDARESQVDERAIAPHNGAATPLASVGRPLSITDIIAHAVDRNIPTEALERLVSLYERIEAKSAAKEFADAMAAFQEDCPSIRKTSTANISTKSGAKFSYAFADLAEIATTIRPFLHKHGLSYSWDSTVKDGTLVCTCKVKHANGHEAQASFGCQTDTAAAHMSGAQQNAAALTFARRQSLIQALGLTTCDRDFDGAEVVEHHGPPTVPEDRITEDEADRLDSALKGLTTDPKRIEAFMVPYGITKLSDMPKSKLAGAFARIESARKKEAK